MGQKPLLAVGVWDIHYPKIDENTFAAVLDFLKKNRNRIRLFVFGGDQFDNECISHHTKGKPLFRPRGQYKLDEDGFKKNVLGPIEKALRPDCKKVWIIGNHDRFEYDFQEEHPEFEGFTERVTSLRLREKGWKIVPLGHPFRHGKLAFYHGEWLTGFGNQAGQYPSRKLVEATAGNAVAGHTHSPQSFARILQADTANKWMGWIAPIVGKTNPTYLRNRPTSWLHGFVIIEFHGDDGNFNLYPVITVKGRFSYGGKLYGTKKGKKKQRPTLRLE